jgi:hypothetical protein
MLQTWKSGSLSSGMRADTKSLTKAVFGPFPWSSQSLVARRLFTPYRTEFCGRLATAVATSWSCFIAELTRIGARRRFIASYARLFTGLLLPGGPTLSTETATPQTTCRKISDGALTMRISRKLCDTAVFAAESGTRERNCLTLRWRLSGSCTRRGRVTRPSQRASGCTGATFKSWFSALCAPSLLLLSGCQTPESIHPPVADLQAAVEPKPVPSDDIATSQKAADDFSASIEAWGDRISAAGGRICRWSERVYKVKVGCPKAD